eukprot:5270406-Prorocentrum_lima.AAC.1
MFVPHQSMTSRGVHYFTVVHHGGLPYWVVSKCGRPQPGTRSLSVEKNRMCPQPGRKSCEVVNRSLS